VFDWQNDFKENKKEKEILKEEKMFDNIELIKEDNKIVNDNLNININNNNNNESKKISNHTKKNSIKKNAITNDEQILIDNYNNNTNKNTNNYTEEIKCNIYF
jgi:hypothetical protein